MPNDDEKIAGMSPDTDGNVDVKLPQDIEPTSHSMASSEQEPQTAAAFSPPEAANPQMSQNPVTEPAVSTGFSEQGSGADGGNKKKRWFIFGGVIAAALVVLIGGMATAYFVYQSPEKVIGDALGNVLTSKPRSVKASVEAESSAAKFNVTVDLKGNDDVANGTITAKVTTYEPALVLEGSAEIAATADGDGYLKLNDVDKLANSVVDAVINAQVKQYEDFGMKMTKAQIKAQKEETLKQIEPIITKINNRWIKFGSDKTGSSVSEQQKCYTDALKKLQSDQAMRSELNKTYAENKFIIIKEELGVQDGSYGYVLDVDKDKVKSFGDAAERTTFAKELQKCGGAGSSSMYNTSSDSSIQNMRVELWVSQWSHQITGLKISAVDTSSASGATKVTFDIRVGYEETSGATIPTDAVDFNDLQKELQGLTPGSTPASTTSSSLST